LRAVEIVIERNTVVEFIAEAAVQVAIQADYNLLPVPVTEGLDYADGFVGEAFQFQAIPAGMACLSVSCTASMNVYLGVDCLEQVEVIPGLRAQRPAIIAALLQSVLL
jgi:hypothetical protein